MAEPLLSTDRLLKRFGGLVATDSVSIDVRPGEIHALIGPNGAGKTTLVSQLTGNLRPDAGTIRFAGRDVTHLPTHARVRLGLARSFQITSVLREFTALGNVALAVQAHAGHSFRFLADASRDQSLREPARRRLVEVGLEARADTVAAALSHGEQRQLEIAMALAGEPSLLLLDEPMAGMGVEESQRMIGFLRGLKGRRAMLLIEHDMDAVFQLADRITVMVYGRAIASGTPDEIRANADVRQAYLGDQESPPPSYGGGGRRRMLSVRDLTAHYGASQALFGMALSVEAGEVVTLMGRNGMGKTTTVNAIMGLLPARRGAIEFEGRRIDQLPSFRIARLGLGLVPEGRQIFPNLSVRENLIAAAANRAGRRNPWTLRRVLDFFPRLGERQRNLGNQLSGGEQQMLAIGRALTTNPKLLILDEATEGLAPLIRQDIWSCLGRLKAEGQAILVIDKNVGALIGLADRHHIVEKGRVVWAGSSAALARDGELQHRYLGV